MTRHQLQSGPRPDARGAFSLVEMMIALVILAFGLLIIGAALPIGLDYNRKSADLAVGEAVTDFAFEVIQTHVRNGYHSAGIDGTLNTNDDAYVGELFRPWDRPGNPPGSPNAWEPRIKVRPLVMCNVDASTRKDEVPELWHLFGPGTTSTESPESIIAKWRDSFPLGAPPPPWYQAIDEADLYVSSSIPTAVRVYPPVTPDRPFNVRDYFAKPPSDPGGRYGQRPATWPGSPSLANRGSETSEALNRLVSWVAFYRRATSYQPGADDSAYEVIVVAAKRPSPEHRFARQDISGGNNAGVFNQPVAVPWPSPNLGQSGPDRVSPTPWLVTFKKLPLLPTFDTVAGQRRIDPPITVAAATLDFECTREVAWLLPPGSIFIPARNEELSSPYADGRRLAGFVPHAPQSLPIYEVVERIAPRRATDPYVIKVKNNGHYPYAEPLSGGYPNPDQWPVWVVPPAVTSSRTSPPNRQLFDRASPIIGYARRVMRFPVPMP